MNILDDEAASSNVQGALGKVKDLWRQAWDRDSSQETPADNSLAEIVGVQNRRAGSVAFCILFVLWQDMIT